MELIALPEFQKLASIRQLGPTYLVYPGAVHTRLSHSVGVFETARRMLLALARSLMLSGRELPWDLEGVKSFLAAALLHDLGHFPYTHSLKDLPLTTHERLASQMILESTRIKRVLELQIGASAQMTAAIIDDSSKTESEQVTLFRTILSGTLDPDKLDYLNRDALFCGVPYGQQDVDFILTKLALTADNRLAIRMKGVGSIEHLLFSKYLMYRNVYWHERVRSATAMIRKALYLGLEDGNISGNELYGLDDHQFIDTYTRNDFPYSKPIAAVSENRLYQTAATVDMNEIHQDLRDQGTRLNMEEHLRNKLNHQYSMNLAPEDLILDIPEPVCFETDLPVLSDTGGQINFSEARPVFSPPVIRGFTETISHLRLFLNHQHKLDKNELLEYLA
jgi:HD superfamily phosphohydrolase